LGESGDEALEGALSGLTQVGLKFGEGHFNGVEIGAVGRKVKQGGPGGLDGELDAFDLVGGEVVADDQVAREQFRAQHFVQVSQEGRAIHGAIEQPRGGEAIVAQRGDEGGTLPVPMRHGGQAALAALASPVKAGHLGIKPGLVQEDQPANIPGRLLLAPNLAGRLKLRPILLGGAQGFF